MNDIIRSSVGLFIENRRLSYNLDLKIQQRKQNKTSDNNKLINEFYCAFSYKQILFLFQFKQDTVFNIYCQIQ